MENLKVYLYMETPFSLKNRRTALLVFTLVALIIGFVFAVTVLYGIGDYETANLVALVFGLWTVCLFVPATLFLVFSHVTLDDGVLVCKYAGFIARRIPGDSVDRVSREQGRVVLYSKGQQVLSLLDCAEARKLLELAHIQIYK